MDEMNKNFDKIRRINARLMGLIKIQIWISAMMIGVYMITLVIILALIFQGLPK